jgi:hypothetical protein
MAPTSPFRPWLDALTGAGDAPARSREHLLDLGERRAETPRTTWETKGLQELTPLDLVSCTLIA